MTEEICEIQVSYNKLYNLYENLNKQYKTLQISHNRLEKYQEKNPETFPEENPRKKSTKQNKTHPKKNIKKLLVF